MNSRASHIEASRYFTYFELFRNPYLNLRMDKKSFHDYYALDHTQESLKTHPRRPYRSRRVLYTLLTVILSCLCFFHISWVFFRWPTNFSSIKFRDGYQELSTTGQKGSQYVLPSATNKTFKVPLEAHVMSKCPDAKDCLRDLVVPAMEKVVDKVDFRLSFIGRYVLPFT